MIQNTPIPVDLHCHSTYSDGAHDIKYVLDLVQQNGGKYIALTDHDTVSGIDEASKYAASIGLHFISGVEISVTWQPGILLHIIGLNVDSTNQSLIDNLDSLRSCRYTRGEEIASKLAKIGIPNALEGALKYCVDKNSLSRTHFARFLVENGYAKPNKVFDKFLIKGAPAYTSQTWATLPDAVNWINMSGGVAIIAHPMRYKMNKTQLQELITDFKSCGGVGIEVVSSRMDTVSTIEMLKLADKNHLLGSVGSDFHNTDNYPKVTPGINYIPEGFLDISIFNKLGIVL